ncbi:MAG: histidine phosphatase family protein [Actinomycetota bacterium]|nr:histidine phosphatase family protein [Actinomycetota bacterium]
MSIQGTGIFLVRHGEVHNPDHVVYANLDGFSLSATGRRQAAEVAGHLPHGAIVVTSPLDRAVETGQIIASNTDGRVVVDEALSEWMLGSRWAGHVWEQLDVSFPGELAAYLEHPEDLPFSPESLVELADRVGAAIRKHRDVSDDPLIFVSHQDPIQAARLLLTGRSLATLNENKPMHAEAIELVAMTSGPWVERGSWTPDQERATPPSTSRIA